MNNKLENKLYKLLALAEGGEGGEKINAQRFLEKLLKKHNLTLADITDEHIETHWFKYKGQIEFKLLRQIIACVTNDRSVAFWKNRKNRKNRKKRETIGADISKNEMLEIELMFSGYSAALKIDIDDLLSAFINKNNIFPNDGKCYDSGNMMPEEKDRMQKILNMMEGVSKPNIRKQIGHS